MQLYLIFIHLLLTTAVLQLTAIMEGGDLLVWELSHVSESMPINYYYHAFWCAVPSGVPTRLKTVSINSVSVLVSWHAPDADEYSNGVLRQYYIEITDNSSSQISFYISDDTHLLLDSLQPGHQYTFRVAAYTTEKGPFSQPISVTLPSLQGTNIRAKNTVYISVYAAF